MKRCLKCNQNLTDDSNFCMYCGSNMVKRIAICPKCKKELPEESKYCLYCGTNVYDSNTNVAEPTHIKPKKKKGLYVFASIALILAIVVGVAANRVSYMNECNLANANDFFNVYTASGEYHVSPGETFTVNCTNNSEATLTSLGSNFFTYSKQKAYSKKGKTVRRTSITLNKGIIIGFVKIKDNKTDKCLYVFVY